MWNKKKNDTKNMNLALKIENSSIEGLKNSKIILKL